MLDELLEFFVVLLVLGLTLDLMPAAGPIMRVVGVAGRAVLDRLLGVLRAALTVQFLMNGVRGALRG